MNHRRPKVVPRRVVLVSPQVALDEVVRNTDVHEGVARQMTKLDRAVLEHFKDVLGHHDKWWCPKQQIMEQRPQPQVEMA